MSIKSGRPGGSDEAATTRRPMFSAAYPQLTATAPVFTGRNEVAMRNKAFDAQTRGDTATYQSIMGQLK